MIPIELKLPIFRTKYIMKLLLTFIICVFAIQSAFAQPNTNFTASPLEICVGETIQFTDLSTSTGTITNWTWDFGDGATSAVQNPTHTYTNSGDFTITLTAVDGNGASPEVKINFIKVNPLPAPSFTTSIIGGCSLPSQVSISNVQPSTGVTYAWDFGNGTTSSSGTPANVTYNSENSYDITLTVTDNITGCVNTIVETVNIFDYHADFSLSSASACAGKIVNFIDNSSPGTNTWNWNFGDGSNSTVQNPTHSYLNAGTYTVILTVTNSVNGCSDTYTETIVVYPLPSPSFTFTPSSGCAPLDVSFTNTSGGTGSFEWLFGDGGSFLGVSPTGHTYLNNGTYSVTLTQTDANGCSNSVTQPNIISVSSITVDFEADVFKGCETLDVNFTDLSNSPNANDPITSWVWDFGNGSVFNGQNPPTQSFTEGVYDVTLTVSTNAGCSQTLTFTDYISAGIAPIPDFSWTPNTGCAKSPYSFTDLTTVPIPYSQNELTYEWSFGDGGVSNIQNPTYEYPLDTGYFDVQLIVKFRGCPDTITYQNVVYIEAPISRFGATSVYCNPTLPLEVTFNDNAIIGKVTDSTKLIWYWGDGTSEAYTSPNVYNNTPGPITHTYNNLGTYTIKQVVHNYTTGCSDSTTQQIHLSKIEADFSVSNDSVCVNSSVYFSGNSTISTHPINHWAYNIDNDTLIFFSNFNYLYDTPGTSDITLIITNSVGCQDTAQFLDLNILALPVANISPSDLAGCSPLTVVFTNNSTNPSGVPISNFEWSFENGTTQTTTNVGQSTNYTFTNEGIFQTHLVVTDEFGCVSPTISVQTELSKPSALFDLPTVVCSDEEFTAINNSTDYSSSEWFINSSSESTNNDFTSSLNHTGSATNLSFTDSVTLIVTDINGCKDTLVQEIIVSTPFADFDFVFSGANVNDAGSFVCPPVFAALTDLSTSFGNISNWNWNFGDGKASTLQNPNNTYVFAGTYSGTLMITDEYGCTSTMIYEDYLTIGGPSGDIDWTLFSQCEQEYTFTPSNLEGVTDILWDMGNGETLHSIDEFNYAYGAAGTYIPTATLINKDDCNITYILDTVFVTVSPLNPYFEINPMSMNWGEPATITDYSTGGYGGIVNWFWNAGGDSFNNNGGSFEHLFNSAGEVTVTLVVTDSAGCQDTYQVVVNISTKLTIPNILTPNGDGINDVFRLIDNAYKSYKVVILNRWGNVVNESYVVEDNYLWDGLKKNGEECHDGVYFYIIDGIQRDGKPRSEHGFVHLVR